MQIVNQLRYREPTAPFIDKGRFAIIDIGSTSIRLVVYDDVRAYPYVVINQRVWATLAENKTDKAFTLKPEKIKRATQALAWFKWVAAEAGCQYLLATATSAVRDAQNREEFLVAARQALGGEVHVLSGQEEAQLASLGAAASIPSAQGLVVDMGGGSLEVSDTKLKHFTSLPLGVLALRNMSAEVPQKAVEILTEAFCQIPWVSAVEGQDLIMIGSGMRSIARLHMAATDYPLDIPHDYHLEREEGIAFCQKLIDGEILPELEDLTKNYKDVLPYRAAALSALLKASKAKQVRFATFGLREGVLFSQLVACPVLDDPLRAFASEMSKRQGRGLAYSKSLAAWCITALPKFSTRFIEAAALFAETSWREQPLYRAKSHFNRVLGGAYVGATHKLRLKLALTSFYSHGVEAPMPLEIALPVTRLLSPQEHQECKILGGLFQLAHLLDPGARGNLKNFNAHFSAENQIKLEGPEAVLGLGSEELNLRLEELSKAYDAYKKEGV